jgi:hypothetical protein
VPLIARYNVEAKVTEIDPITNKTIAALAGRVTTEATVTSVFTPEPNIKIEDTEVKKPEELPVVPAVGDEDKKTVEPAKDDEKPVEEQPTSEEPKIEKPAVETPDVNTTKDEGHGTELPVIIE